MIPPSSSPSSDTPADTPVASAADPFSALDPDFLALLACPRCAVRPPLGRGENGQSLVCGRCGRVYPFTEGFPDLRLTEEEIAAAEAADSESAGTEV